MTAAWMTYTLVVGGLLGLAALGLERACRLARRPGRFVWAAALVGTAALTLLAPHRAASSRDSFVPTATTVTASATPAVAADQSGLGAAIARVERSASELGHRVAAALAVRTTPALDRWLARGWVVLSGALLLLLVGVQLRFGRARRRWPRAELHGATVRVAPETGPAVVGLAHPEIVVPRWLLQRAADEQRLVIAHEEEHLRVHDPLLLAGACALTALLAWHPAAWWMLSRLRLAVELDCDERVLRRGAARRAYGTLLIELAGHRPGLSVGAAALADQPSHLERRLLAMRHDRPLFPRARATILAALSAAALLVACEAKLPTSAEVNNMDVASAERGAAKAQLVALGDSLTEYTVDGKRVDVAQAHALKPEEIAAIEVTKRKDGSSEHSSVRITTRHSLGLASAAPGSSPVQQVRMKVSAAGSNGISVEQDSAGHREMVRTFDGVVLIDGVRSTHAAMQALDPSSIVSVEIIKGPAAAKLYDAPEAANGVIRITTKNGKR